MTQAENSIMNFKNWMRKNYLEDNTWKGRLARDIRTDETFPKNGVVKFEGWRILMREYLEKNHACSECLEAFETCWKEYEKCERVILKLRLPKQ